jgi:hypothetical protein
MNLAQLGPRIAVLLTVTWFCSCATATSAHGPEQKLSHSTHYEDDGGGGGFGKNSAEARITHLISEGEFVKAEALIAESSRAGLMDQAVATALRKSIAEQSMKLGEIPASLQRVSTFPAKLRDFTRHEIQRMLDKKDFTLATKKELQTALKLLKEYKRLMQEN